MPVTKSQIKTRIIFITLENPSYLSPDSPHPARCPHGSGFHFPWMHLPLNVIQTEFYRMYCFVCLSATEAVRCSHVTGPLYERPPFVYPFRC